MARPFLIGLTGSIGMGKSATAKLFADRGVPVWDADAAVARLYAPGGAALPGLRALRDGLVTESGADRDALRAWIAEDPAALPRIEALVHPLVSQDRERFIARATAPILCLDIPLLFETGGDTRMDLTVVVTAPPEEQRRRVLERPGMTPERFDAMLAKQMPDAQKRARADEIIETTTPEAAAARVDQILAGIRERLQDA